MGQLVVNCINRPPDEMIDCGVYGLRKNMHTHDVPAVDGELVLGFPLEEGKSLPKFSDKSASKGAAKPSAPVSKSSGANTESPKEDDDKGGEE